MRTGGSAAAGAAGGAETRNDSTWWREERLWAFTGARMAVRFVYECRDERGAWKRAHGNEQWEFDEHGLMRRREASINDVPITEGERLFRWPLGRRPDDHPGLTGLGL